MPQTRINLFFKVFIIVFVCSTLAILVGRDHFILGTILILFRWIFFATGLCLLYLTSKRVASKHLKIGLLVILISIPLEFLWTILNKKNLENDLTLTTEVSLMTYNIFFKNSSPGSSIARINDFNPDILALQELTPNLSIQLENSFKSKYPFKKTIPLRGTHGIGIYSKYPITNFKFLENNNNLPFALILELEVNNKKIQIINAHLASPAVAVENPENFLALYSSNYNLRHYQLQQINELAADMDGKYSAQLLMGDLNTTSYEPLYRSALNEWVNLYDMADVGWAPSFPNSSKIDPILTLDYILGRGYITVIEMNVVKGGSSDHLALTGKIKI